MIVTFAITNAVAVNDRVVRFEVTVTNIPVAYHIAVMMDDYITRNEDEITVDIDALQHEISRRIIQDMAVTTEITKYFIQQPLTWKVELNENIPISTEHTQ